MAHQLPVLAFGVFIGFTAANLTKSWINQPIKPDYIKEMDYHDPEENDVYDQYLKRHYPQYRNF